MVESTALVLIDLMPRIVALETAPRSGADVLARSVRLLAAFRKAGGFVVSVRVERPGVPEQPPGSGFSPEVAPRDGELEVVKRAVNAFHATGLETSLRQRSISTVVLAGLVTNWGVEATARTASDHGFDVVLIEDAMAGFTAEDHDFAVRRIFPRLGTVTTTEEFLAGLTPA